MPERPDPHGEGYRPTFRSPLEDLPGLHHTRIKQLAGDENHVVREATLDQIHAGELPRAQRLGVLVEARRQFDVLEEEIGLALPRDRQFVVGTDQDGREQYYLRAEKVIGPSLPEVLREPLTDSRRHDLTKLGEQLAVYVARQINTNGAILTDLMHLKQYRYGHTASDPRERLYLADLDPRLELTPNDGLYVNEEHARQAQYLAQFLGELEQYTGQRNEAGRTMLNTAYHELVQRGQNDRFLDAIVLGYLAR